MERVLLILLTIVSLLFGGQPTAGPPGQEVTAPRPGKTYQVSDLVNALTAAGLVASDTGQTLDGEAFGAPGVVVRVQGEDLQVYVYQTPAEQELVKISPDGSSIEYDGVISMVEWLAPPHFARKGNLLISFATNDEALAARVMEAIEQMQ